MKFAKEHARGRPQDVFSVVTFHESSTVLCQKVSSAELSAGVTFEDRAANGTFYLQALTSAAHLLQGSPELQGDTSIHKHNQNLNQINQNISEHIYTVHIQSYTCILYQSIS